MPHRLNTPLTQSFFLPDLEAMLSVFPDRGFNPYYKEIRPQSHNWISQFSESVYGAEMRAYMNNCELELLNGYCYPYAGKDGLRATMDLHNILWLYDEFTDTQSGEEAERSADIVFEALHSEEICDNSWVRAMMKDFKTRHIARAGPNTAYRFISHFCDYARAVGREAILRHKDDVLEFHPYMAFRRDISGVRVCFDLVVYCIGIDLSQELYDDPVFQTGLNAAMDLICLGNDIYSYNKEQSVGHSGANAVTVVMRSKNLDLQRAMDFLGGYSQGLVDQLTTAHSVVAARGGVAASEQMSILEAFGDWVRGNVRWSFVTPRYFGRDTKELNVDNMLQVMLRAPFVDAVPL
ncbi:isoprenoid synthase domain-containing protein, partial [Mycena rebaudengoi]